MVAKDEVKTLLNKNKQSKSPLYYIEKYHIPATKITNVILLTIASLLFIIGGSIMKNGNAVKEFGITYIIFSSLSFIFQLFTFIILRSLIDIRIGIRSDLLTSMQQITGFFLYLIIPIASSIAMLVCGALLVDAPARARDVHPFCIIWGGIALGIGVLLMVVDFFIFNGNYSIPASKIITLLVHFGATISLIVGSAFMLDGKLIKEFSLEFIIFSSISIFLLLVTILVLRYIFLRKEMFDQCKEKPLRILEWILGVLTYMIFPFLTCLVMFITGILIFDDNVFKSVKAKDVSIFTIIWGSFFLVLEIISSIVHFVLAGGSIRFK
jgi:hypothetical protein